MIALSASVSAIRKTSHATMASRPVRSSRSYASVVRGGADVPARRATINGPPVIVEENESAGRGPVENLDARLARDGGDLPQRDRASRAAANGRGAGARGGGCGRGRGRAAAAVVLSLHLFPPPHVRATMMGMLFQRQPRRRPLPTTGRPSVCRWSRRTSQWIRRR